MPRGTRLAFPNELYVWWDGGVLLCSPMPPPENVRVALYTFGVEGEARVTVSFTSRGPSKTRRDRA